MTVAAGVHDGGVDEVAVLHAIEQGVAEGGLAVVAAEGAIGIEHEAALELARVSGRGLVLVEFLEVVARRGGEAELVADEIVEHGAGIAADGAVRFVRDDEVEIGGRKERLVFVVEEKRLDGGDDDLGMTPIVTILFVDDASCSRSRGPSRKPSSPDLRVRAGPRGKARGGRCRSGGRA